MSDRSLHCGNRHLNVFGSCDLDLDPMTFIYELHPHCLELYRMCKYELPSSYVKAFESYHLTDKQTNIHYRQTESTVIIINHAAWRVVKRGS